MQCRIQSSFHCWKISNSFLCFSEEPRVTGQLHQKKFAFHCFLGGFFSSPLATTELFVHAALSWDAAFHRGIPVHQKWRYISFFITLDLDVLTAFCQAVIYDVSEYLTACCLRKERGDKNKRNKFRMGEYLCLHFTEERLSA